MLPRNHPDRIQITFDDHRLVANAGLLLRPPSPGIWACGNSLTITSSSAARRGGTACTLGGTVKAPSTLGTLLRSFRWG